MVVRLFSAAMHVDLLPPNAALTTTVRLAVMIGLLAGYYRGWIDALLSRAMDVVWAFPVLLLGIALGTARQPAKVKLGPVQGRWDSPDSDPHHRLRRAAIWPADPRQRCWRCA